MVSNKITVKEIKAQLDMLPDDMVVSFTPVSGAWLGTEFPMRFGGTSFFKDGGEDLALPSDDGAYCTIYLHEDDSKQYCEMAPWEKENNE